VKKTGSNICIRSHLVVRSGGVKSFAEWLLTAKNLSILMISAKTNIRRRYKITLKLFREIEKLRKAPLTFGIVFTVIGVMFAALGFTVGFGGAPSPTLQVSGILMILGGLVVAIQGAVAKTP